MRAEERQQLLHVSCVLNQGSTVGNGLASMPARLQLCMLAYLLL